MARPLPPASLMRMSAFARLGLAGLVVALVWAAAFWAMGPQ